MDAEIEHALTTDTLIDMTTMGRKTGTPRRIEIAFHTFDGQLSISGLPGKRDWYANLVANPHFTFHLKQLQDGTQLDLAGGVQVIFTPGHTPGHICLYLERSKTLIAGDALTASAGRSVSCG